MQSRATSDDDNGETYNDDDEIMTTETAERATATSPEPKLLSTFNPLHTIAAWRDASTKIELVSFVILLSSAVGERNDDI